MAVKSKESRIKAEKKRLCSLYKTLPESRHKLATGLIDRAAFMRVELDELEADLQKNGWSEMFSQGKQEPYERARPSGQVFNTMSANYLKVIHQLDSMLPKAQQPQEEGDGFDEFICERGGP